MASDNIYPVWVEIDLGAVAHNVREIKRVVSKGSEIMAVVKANGYGHGALEVAYTALRHGVTRLAVARASEGTLLRDGGINSPILVLGYTPREQLGLIFSQNLTQTVFSLDYAREVNEAAFALGVKANVHVKVDTGMGRIGFNATAGGAVGDILALAGLGNLEVEGIFTHFASADGQDLTKAKMQLELFLELIRRLRAGGLYIPLRHCANSAAIAVLPESHLDMVRPGIILYGLHPSRECNNNVMSLRPAMTFKTVVAMVKKVAAGTTVSYGCTYICPGEMLIATLPVGYADGYSRLLSSQGEVLLRGKRAPVLGRVCMDQCMIDVTHIPGVRAGEQVVLFGSMPHGTPGSIPESIPVEEVAEKTGTINYETVCGVSDRVPRVYIDAKPLL